MDKKEIKERCDLSNIKEVIIKNTYDEDYKADYIIDSEGNNIIPVSILEFKIIKKLEDLQKQIDELKK